MHQFFLPLPFKEEDKGFPGYVRRAAVDGSDLKGAAAGGPAVNGQFPSSSGKPEQGAVRMVGFGKGGLLEADVKTEPRGQGENPGKIVVREGPAEEPRRKGQVAALVVVTDCQGTGGMEGECAPFRRSAEQVRRHAADSPRTCGVGARGASHHRP